MVPVEILGVHLDPRSGATIVLLSEIDDRTRVLPIFVGPAEAQAIALGLQEIQLPRPGTHDLMVDMMDLLDTHLLHVDVTDLQDGTFFAELELETGGEARRLSTRPSDGLALATRVGVPIFVSRTVFEDAAVSVRHEPDTPFEEHEIEEIMSEFEDFLARAEPQDFLADPSEHDEDNEVDEGNEDNGG